MGQLTEQLAQEPVVLGEVVVLEVRRAGRRPRYHLGARLEDRPAELRPPQCNLSMVALDVRELDALPPLKRPRTQLCRRCFAGHPLLEAQP